MKTKTSLDRPSGFIEVFLVLVLFFFPHLADAQRMAPRDDRIRTLQPERPLSVTPVTINLPDTLLIGDFTLTGVKYSNTGRQDTVRRQVKGVSGTGRTRFSCLEATVYPVIPNASLKIKHLFKVVPSVTDPCRQISLEDVRLIHPHANLGETVELDLVAADTRPDSILRARDDLLEKLKPAGKAGEILVSFDNVTIAAVSGETGVGRIEEGEALYPTAVPEPKTVTLALGGFSARITSLKLRPAEATADMELIISSATAVTTDCKPASVTLGSTAITRNCEFYVQKNGASFGSWLMGDTGMVASGNGFTADFSSTRSPSGKPASWKGLVLHAGEISGSPFLPADSNTGYLAGTYTFTNGDVTVDGFAAEGTLSRSHTFYPSNPTGYTVTLNGGRLNFSKGTVTSGQLGPGTVLMPPLAACRGTGTGTRLSADFSLLTVQDDLDLGGTLSFPTGTRVGWGELTHPGDEVVAWNAEPMDAFLYLPGTPRETYCPDTGSGFTHYTIPSSLSGALAQLEAAGMAGVTLLDLKSMDIHSQDRPGGTSNPIRLSDIRGWLRIGVRGVDGDLESFQDIAHEDIGNATRLGYVGIRAFSATFAFDHEKKRLMFFQYASSAVYDSEMNGSVRIPDPCGIVKLEFKDMETTSTADLVGGDVVLPPGGVTLSYWKLDLVPLDSSGQAGVLSVRTGRVLFTAAGISEPVHFAQPFALTWGEMRADGNFGELFISHNAYGQRFDGIPFSANHLALSAYVPGATDGYLAVCGTAHFNFFGSHFVNIRDARYDDTTPAFYKNRYVTVPKSDMAACQQTDLHLEGSWNNRLAAFDFPDADMGYNETIQDGFIGTGTGELSFLHSDGLDATIEIHSDATDICLSSTTTHDIDFGLFTRLGSIGQLYGCVRIEGPLLKRIALGGYLEHSTSAGFGILAPKTGYLVETNMSVTPNSCTFAAAGDMLLSMAGTAVDISGSAYLHVDYTRDSAEGDVLGRIDCNSALAGLAGEGQVTWYVDPLSQYFQGKVKMEVCSWIGSAGLEGGLFLGHNVPKAKAWVLYTGSDRFGVSDRLLPTTLTGLYGYGKVSFSVQWYVFGGGIEVYAGMGAFTETPSGGSSLWNMSAIGLPYVLGSAGVYVHGEILGGLVSASAWGDLDLRGPLPIYYEGTFGLEGCVLWVICASVDVTAGISPSDGFYIH